MILAAIGDEVCRQSTDLIVHSANLPVCRQRCRSPDQDEIPLSVIPEIRLDEPLGAVVFNITFSLYQSEVVVVFLPGYPIACEIKVDHIVMILAQVEAHISDQVRSLWPNRLQPAGESGAAQPTLKPVDEENCC